MTGAFGSSDKEFNLDMKITKFVLHLYIFFQIPRPWSIRDETQYVCVQ